MIPETEYEPPATIGGETIETNDVPEVIAPVEPVEPEFLSIILKVGENKTGMAQPVDAAGENAAYAIGSISYSSADPSICKCVESTSDEFYFMLTGTAVGSTVATVTLKDMAGNLLTKQINITVQPVQPLAVDIKITFD